LARGEYKVFNFVSARNCDHPVSEIKKMKTIGVRFFFVVAIIISCATARIANLGLVGHAHYVEKWLDLYGCIVSTLEQIAKNCTKCHELFRSC